ncbi:unnamed protein product [Auanema sp. JU1783]|nr:unnamed protein product [Auanema sp. JU1783]
MAFAYQHPLVTNIALLPVHKSDDSNLNKGNIYSTFSLLPIILVLAVVLGVYTFCKVRRCREEKKQILHLANFYDSIEYPNYCEKGLLPQKEFFNKLENKQNATGEDFDRIRQALMIPPIGSSPFYQPIGTQKACQAAVANSVRPFIVRKV